MLECKTDDARLDAMWCFIATHKFVIHSGLRQPQGRIYNGSTVFNLAFLNAPFAHPSKSNASPHLATGSGFVNGSAFWDVVLMYNSFIIIFFKALIYGTKIDTKGLIHVL